MSFFQQPVSFDSFAVFVCSVQDLLFLGTTNFLSILKTTRQSRDSSSSSASASGQVTPRLGFDFDGGGADGDDGFVVDDDQDGDSGEEVDNFAPL